MFLYINAYLYIRIRKHEVIKICTTSSVAKFKENIAITGEGRINRNKETSNGSITQMNGFESTTNAALAVIRTVANANVISQTTSACSITSACVMQ